MSSNKDYNIRLAHISDLHFSKPSCSPLQFFSKRWIGNFNLIFSRKKNFATSRLDSLIAVFKKNYVEYVVISGDLSTTSLQSEFLEAKQFVKKLEDEGMKVFTLPGNHDHYTKQAYKDRLFYNFFNCSFSIENSPIYNFNLKKHQLAAQFLGHNWWLIALDTAIATSLISSRGYFSKELEENLQQALQYIPHGHQIILANHFPFFDHESPRKTLVRSLALRHLIQKFPNIKIYLHGHTHRHCLADLRANNLPIISDTGSTSHKDCGAWNLIDINPERCKVDVFKWGAADRSKSSDWQPAGQACFNW